VEGKEAVKIEISVISGKERGKRGGRTAAQGTFLDEFPSNYADKFGGEPPVTVSSNLPRPLTLRCEARKDRQVSEPIDCL
jgi:hypothetical protein